MNWADGGMLLARTELTKIFAEPQLADEVKGPEHGPLGNIDPHSTMGTELADKSVDMVLDLRLVRLES